MVPLEKNEITKQGSTALKGVLSILVLLCHCRSYIRVIDSNFILSQIFITFGYGSVGFFFFLSGYGLMAQYSKKQDYLKYFLKNRVLVFYIKYMLLVIGYGGLFFVAGLFNLQLFIKSFLFGGTVVVNGWYFQATLFLYLVFFAAFFGKIENGNTKKLVFLLAGIILYIFVCKGLKLESHWYQSVLCLWFGTLYYQYQEKFGLSVKCGALFLAAGILLLILKSNGWLPVFLNTVAVTAIVICLIFAVISSGVLYGKGSKLLTFLGGISLELYAVHGAYITIFRSGILWIKNDFVFLSIVLFFSILSAWILHKFFSAVERLIKNNDKKVGI